MQDLRAVFTKSGFLNIKSYLQSGNVVFQTTENDSAAIVSVIQQNFESQFGYSVPVIVMDSSRLEEIVEGNPFIKTSAGNLKGLFVTFLHSIPKFVDTHKFEDKKTPLESFKVSGDVVYLYCPGNYSKTKLNNNFLESTLGVQATSRNWKTTTEILKLLSQYS